LAIAIQNSASTTQTKDPNRVSINLTSTANKTPTKKVPETLTPSQTLNTQTLSPKPQSKHNLRASNSGSQLQYTLVTVKDTSNTQSNQSAKSYQPILVTKKSQIDLSQGNTAVGNSRTPSLHSGGNYRKSSTSFSHIAEKAAKTTNKSGSKPTASVIVKEAPFAYEERQKSADQLGKSGGTKGVTEESLKDVQKSLQYESRQPTPAVSYSALDRRDIKVVEVFN
jgi:hypothetical protein